VTWTVKSPAVVSNFTWNVSGACAFSVAGCSNAGSGPDFVVFAAAVAGFFAGAWLDAGAWAATLVAKNVTARAAMKSPERGCESFTACVSFFEKLFV
jgi:hypothetical protein